MGLILILAWMYSTSELDKLFQILNLIEKDLNLKGLKRHRSNTTVDHDGTKFEFFIMICPWFCVIWFYILEMDPGSIIFKTRPDV